MLLASGCVVSVVDDGSRGRPEHVAGLDLRWVKQDIREAKGLAAVFLDLKPQIVVHLAAMHFIPDCNRDPSGCLATNVVGTENVLDASRQTKVRRVIVASSVAVYPIDEKHNREEDAADPCDVYGESKLANELQARRFWRETGTDTVAVRLSNVYGPRETNPHVIPEIMIQLRAGTRHPKLGNVEPMRDFIHTTDAARGFSALALEPLPRGCHTVNLGGGEEYSIRQVLEELSLITGATIEPVVDPSRYRKVERMHLRCDIRKMQELVPWRPKVTLREGLDDLCVWYGVDRAEHGT